MQNSANPARPDQRLDERKHKTSAADTLASSKQQTISDLFSASQLKSVNREAVDTLSPSSKRPRLDSGPHPQPAPRPLDPAPPLPPTKMYSFPAKNTANSKSSNVIDLTSSPPPTKTTPRKNNILRPVNGPTTSLNPHLGAKSIVVKNFRTTPRTDPKQYFDLIWTKLDAALDVVFSNDKITFSLEELYRGVENVCRQGFAEQLNSKLQDKSRKHVEETLRQPIVKKSSVEDVDILRGVLSAWTTWKKQLETMSWIFCYMDRAYLLSKGVSLQELAIDLFRTVILDDSQLKSKAINGACDLVEKDRDQRMPDNSTFRDAIEMFHDTATYTSAFEPRMLKHSQDFIVAWARRAKEEMEVPQYVQESIRLMSAEKNRCDVFNLDSSTRRSLMELLDTYLVEDAQEKLINDDAVADLLDLNAGDDLKALYAFLERRKRGAKLRPAFEKWISLTGTDIVFDEKEQEQMVVKLLCLKKQLDTIWRVSFNRNEELGHGLRESFETFINKTKKTNSTWGTDNSKPGEMIAKYVDLLLRGGAKAIPTQLIKSNTKAQVAEEEDNEDVVFDEDTEVNNQLDQVLDLFRFVHGKAVFEAFYKKDLARRLLMGRSASADAERSMLTRLKTECGAGFTQNLEQMFKDVEVSREEMSAYKQRIADRNEKSSLEISVNVLSASAWPTYEDKTVIIPPDIKGAIDKFEEHYRSKHSNRKLQWKHALAHCQLKASYPKGKKELVVSSFQAIVLLLFNGKEVDEQLSYEFIKAATGLAPAELDRTLQSLACARIRPLTKHPKSREISPTDVFTLNASFSDPKYRIKINTVQLKETAQENKETHERVQADRNFECQAAIVRILKSRKTIGHNELITEVITETRKRGVLQPSDIKKNIDRLIEKEYMEREDGNMYSYVA